MLKHIENTCVIVLGRPRSGTSMVAGILHRLGVNMGDVLLAPKPANPSGFYEDEELLKIHDLMIGQIWHDPNTNGADSFVPTYQDLIKNRQHQKLWGVKDPRLCFLLPYLLDALGDYNVKLILTERPVSESAKSMISLSYAADNPRIRLKKLMAKRPPGATFVAANIGGVEDELTHAIEVCGKYDDARAEAVQQSGLEFLSVSYSNVLTDPEIEISKICEFISHIVSMDDAIDFVRPDLKHF